MRRIRFLALLLLAVAALLGAASAASERDEPRWAWLLRLAARQVPGLTLEGLGGSLTRPEAARVTLADAEGVWLTLEGVRLAIDGAAVLRRRLQIEAVTAERGVLARLPAAQTGAPPAPTPSGPLLPTLPQLPVDLRIERLAVERLELGEPVLGLAAALALDGRVALAGGVLEAALSARRLDAPGGTLRLRLALNPAADRLEAEAELREPPGGLVAGLAGLPDRPAELDLSLAGPAAAGARLELRGTLGPEVSLALAGTVRAGADGSAGAVLEGTAALAPLLPEEVAPVATPAGFALDAAYFPTGRLDLRRLRLGAPAGEAEAQGTVDLRVETLDLQLRLALAGAERFAALLPSPDLLSWPGLRAEGRLTGALARPRLTLEATAEGFGSGIAPLAAALGPDPSLRLSATLPDTVETFRLQGAQATLEASGRIGDVLDARFALELADLAALQPDLSGALTVSGTARGPLADPTIAVQARGEAIAAAGQRLETPQFEALIETPATAPRLRATAEARFAGLPLRLALRGEPVAGAQSLLRIEEAAASLGPAALTAAGTVDTAAGLFDGGLRLDVPDLAPLARLAGDDTLAGRLRLEARLAPTAERRQGFDARLEAPALRVGGVAAEGTATARGTPEAADIGVQAAAAGAAASARGRLAAMEEAGGARGVRLDLAALELRHGGETLRATAPARLLLHADGGAEIATPLALTTGRGGTIRASGRWGPERADLHVSLAALPAALLTALGDAAGPPLEGTLSGDLRATGPVARPELAATLRAGGLRSAAAPWARDLPAAEVRLDGTLAGTVAELRAEASAGPALRLAATARLPEGFGPQAPLAATITGNAELAPLLAPFLAAGADRVTGRIALDLRAGGTLGAPDLSGRATLWGGEYRNLLYGVRVTDAAGTLRADGTRLVLERLEGRTPNGGRITATGAMDVGVPGLPVEATITAREARPLASDQYSVLLDADLRFAGGLAEAAGSRLSGVVRIARADIRVPEGLPPSVRTLEVRERGRPPPGAATRRRAAAVAARRGAPQPATATAEAPGPPIALAVVVEARNVFVRGRGLDAELGGRLEIGGTVADPAIEGALTLQRGTLQVLDRRLAFDRGALRFGGGTLVPTLDFLATARRRDTTLRIAVEGTAAAPKFTFSSTPELPQDEVLARLLFDRPTSNLSPFEIAQLAQALAGVTGIGGDLAGGGLLDRVRRGLGLDRLAVGSSQDAARRTGRSAETNRDSPTLEAGSYVADGVFVGVRQGTDAGSTRVGVEIELAPRLKLEAEVGGGGTGAGGNRVGLSYELEY